MRFRKKLTLFPGVTLNISKTGISSTIGVRGASVNLNKSGTYLNTSIPGTGLFNRKKIDGINIKNEKKSQLENFDVAQNENLGEIKSEKAESITTKDLKELKKILEDCHKERIEIKNEIKSQNLQLIITLLIRIFFYLIVIGFFVKKFTINHNQVKEYLQELHFQLSKCQIDLDMTFDSNIEDSYKNLHDNQKKVVLSDKIWDITSAISIDQKAQRTLAQVEVDRKEVKFGFNNMEIIKSKLSALHFENANGGDFYVYPAFIAIMDSNKKFGLIDFKELNFSFTKREFIERNPVPKDSKVVNYTWAKINKNGSPDKRFKENYEIPICLYGELTFSTNTGLNETFVISNLEFAEKFAQSFTNFLSMLKFAN